MKFKEPEMLNVNIKGTRGMAGEFKVFLIEPVFPRIVTEYISNYVSLKPGEEIVLVVSIPVSTLPLNADIKKLKATLDVQKGDESDKPKFSQTSTIKEGAGTPRTFTVDVEMPPLPRNISVRLEGGDIFWSFSDVAVQGTYDLPDFVEHINIYLDTLPADAKEVSLRFLVKSDGPGKVNITIKDIESLVIQTQSWPNPLDDTIRFDRNLQLNFSMIERVPLDPISDQNKNLKKITMDIGGELGQERLLGSVETHNGKAFAIISSDYSLAQSLRFSSLLLGSSINVVGITGCFQSGTEAELYIEIQNDLNGYPTTDLPLAKLNLSLGLEGSSENKVWTSSDFESPVDLKPDTPYWIVIRGIRGRVQLGLQTRTDGYLQQLLVNRGGQLWKRMMRSSDAGPESLLRLIYLPEIDNQTAAIEMGIEGTTLLQPLDPGPTVQTISFDFKDFTGKQPSIFIKSHARGTLSIANVIQEYSPT